MKNNNSSIKYNFRQSYNAGERVSPGFYACAKCFNENPYNPIGVREIQKGETLETCFCGCKQWYKEI